MRCSAPMSLVIGGVLVMLAAATEGVGLALLAPLPALLSENARSVGWIGMAVRNGPTAPGLPLSTPVLLAIFVGLIVMRAVFVGLRKLKLSQLGLDFSDLASAGLSSGRRRVVIHGVLG